MSQCWNCRTEINDPDFCTQCGKIQPLLENIDFFRFLGFKEVLNVDMTDLEERFFELSKKFHPDFYQTRSEEEQKISLEKASYLNKAYKTLKNPFSMAKYLLELMMGDKSNKKKNIPPDLLMEVMELHEIIDSMKNETEESVRKEKTKEVIRIRSELQKRSGSLGVELLNLFSNWDTVAEHWNGQKLLCAEHRNMLREMNDILVVRQYLETLLQSIDEEIPEEIP